MKLYLSLHAIDQINRQLELRSHHRTFHPTIIRVSNRFVYCGCDFGCCGAYYRPAEILCLGSIGFSVYYLKTKPYKLDIQEP